MTDRRACAAATRRPPSWSVGTAASSARAIDPFITGFIENNNYLGRPADVLVLKDGSMLVSDDFNGAVYRDTYSGASVGK